MRVQHTHPFFSDFIVHEFAVPAIIGETVSVFLGNTDIKHIRAVVAKSHVGEYMTRYMVYLDKNVYAPLSFNFI
jgi:ribosomal protein S19